MKAFLSFLIILVHGMCANVHAQQATGKVVEGTSFPGIFHSQNYVKNPGSEKNSGNLTSSAAIATRSTTTPLLGVASFSIDGTASGQTVKFDTATLDNILSGKNCEARFDYSGDAALYKAYVEQGSTKVTADLQLTSVSSGAQTASINFACGDLSSNSHMVIETTSASAAAIKVDNVYLGAATNLSNVSQSQNVVQYTWTGSQTANHDSDILMTWSGATGRLQNFTHSSGVFTATVAGDYSYNFCASLDLNTGITSVMRGMMAKAYYNSATVPLKGGGYVHGLGQNNVNSGGEGIAANGFANGAPCVSGTKTLAVGDTLRFKAYQANGAGSSAVNWTAAQLEINYLPSASQLALTPNTSPAYWSGYHDNTCNWTRTNTIFGDFAADATCGLVNQTSSNITCSTTGSVLPALSCSFPRAGVYNICAVIDTRMSVAANTLFRLVDGASFIPAEAETYIETANVSKAVTLCGLWNVTSTTGIIYLHGASSSGTLSVVASGSANRSVTWSITNPSQNLPVPLLVGSVTSSSTGAERSERGVIGNGFTAAGVPTGPCTTGSCTVSQPGDWITGVSWASTGRYTVSIKAGTFTKVPTCLCSFGWYGVTTGGLGGCEATGVTTVEVVARNSAFTVTDNIFSIRCEGPR